VMLDFSLMQSIRYFFRSGTHEGSPYQKGSFIDCLQALFEEFARKYPPMAIREIPLVIPDIETFWQIISLDDAYVYPYYFKGIPDDFKVSDFAPLTASVKLLKRDSVDAVNLMPLTPIKELFNSNYRDPNSVVKRFATFLINCSNDFKANPTLISSPYVSVVQSSFYGKTRLVREIARTYFRTVYVCLRDEDSPGYPVRTEGAFTHLFSGLSDLENGKDFSRLLADRFRRLISSAMTNLMDPQDAGNRIHKEDNRLGVNYDECKFPSELIPDLLWNDHLLQPWTENDQFPGNESTSSSSLIFLAIDEARYTLEAKSSEGVSLFRYIRNAARIVATSLPGHLRFMIAFLDTTSRIQNFSPSAERDSKDVIFDTENAERVLFRPYVLIRTSDVFFTPELSARSQNLEGLVHSTKWLNAGRPIMKLADPKDNILVLKLQGGLSEPRNPVDKVAIILARVGAQVLPTHSFSSELVSGNMATLLGTNTARDRCLTRFVSEPALARAAGKIWDIEGMLEGTLLPALHTAILSEAFNRGRDGEIVAQVVLLLAFDAACKELKRDCGDVVPLRLFIKQLLPQNVVDEEAMLDNCIPAHLNNAMIACCQFVHLSARLKLKTILELAERHSGGVLTMDHPGLDLFVPILFSQIAAVVVQIKACSQMFDLGYPLSAGAHLRPSHAFKGSESLKKDVSLKELDSNCVRIYMQVGIKDPKKSVICAAVNQDSGEKPYPLQLFGLLSRCIRPRVRECLEGILIDQKSWDGFQKIDEIECEKNGKFTGPVVEEREDTRTLIAFANDADDDYSDYSKTQLQEALKKRGLKTTGVKATLIRRLEEQDVNLVLSESSLS